MEGSQKWLLFYMSLDIELRAPLNEVSQRSLCFFWGGSLGEGVCG